MDTAQLLADHIEARLYAGLITVDVADIQCSFPTEPDFFLRVDAAGVHPLPGRSPNPYTEFLFASREVARSVFDGTMDGRDAFMRGVFRATGHIALAVVASDLFRDPYPLA